MKFRASGGALFGALLAITVCASVVDAHAPSVVPSCTGLGINLTNYETTQGPATNNKATITIDGIATVVNFDSTYANTFAWSDSAPHAWSVVIDANLNNGNATQWDRTFGGTQQSCNPTTSTTSTTTTTLPEETTTTQPESSSSSSSVPSDSSSTSSPSSSPTEPSITVDQGTSPVPPEDAPLPATGVNSTNLIVIALTLIVVGAVLLRLSADNDARRT